MAPFFLAYGLVKGAYIGTEALSTVVMHVAKLIAYRESAVLLTPRNLKRSWQWDRSWWLDRFAGKRMVDRLPERVFRADHRPDAAGGWCDVPGTAELGLTISLFFEQVQILLDWQLA